VSTQKSRGITGSRPLQNAAAAKRRDSATAFNAAALLLVLFFIGCDKKQEAGTPLKELRLGYFANATHAQAVLGVDSGDFAKAIGPTELTTKVFNAGPSLIEALFANEIDIGYVGPGPAINAHIRSKGQGIRVVAGSAANGVVIVVPEKSEIRSLKDLAGKKIASPQHGNTQDIAARHFVTAELKQSGHENVIAVANAEQAGLMQRGQIDAAWVPEPWGARLVAEAGGRIIAEEKDLWPNKEFSLTVIVVSPDFLKAHPDVVKKILSVHHQWTRRLNSDPAGAVQPLDDALAKLTGKRLPAGVLAAALPRVKFTNEPLEETFKVMGDWTYELQFVPQPPQLGNLFELSLLREVEKGSP
jgi:NitT/TauT family transport system substrate-binding protein